MQMRSIVQCTALLIPTVLLICVDSVQASPEPLFGSPVGGVRLGLSLEPEHPVLPSDLSLSVTLHNTTNQIKTLPASLCGQITWLAYTQIAIRSNGGKLYRVPLRSMIDTADLHQHGPLLLQPHQKLEAKLSFIDIGQQYPQPDGEVPLSALLTQTRQIELWAELSMEHSRTISSQVTRRSFGLKPIEKPISASCAAQLVTSHYLTCLLNRAGTPYCWGETDPGAGPEELSYPRALRWLAQSATSIGFGNGRLCAVTTDRDVLCLSEASEGVSSRKLTNPHRITGLPSGLSRIVSGTADQCVLTDAGALWCWGRMPQTIPPGDVLSAWRAQPMPGLGQDVVEVVFGWQHACARKRSGEVLCWGDNKVGQLGSGTPDASETPKAVIGIGGEVKKIVAGNLFSCALRTDGKLFCWGKNEYGALGKYSAPAQLTATERTDLGTDLRDLFAGHDQLCVLRKEGQLQCLGTVAASESVLSTQTPVTLDGIPPDVAEVTIGPRDACARTSQGALWCWGQTLRAMTKPDEKKPPDGPQRVTGLSSVQSVHIGPGFWCAATQAGSVSCWGDGSGGQLGKGRIMMSAKPLRLDIPCDK
uniref:Regulator of chromosome condensation, RCC1 n=1 Tax=uncultured bacterium A1Q1_fos_565 TaxID=1256585 RepID=L7VZU2_9BACT|nr:regulator of chromosome condensation, RCC1 [uncultured bacterium A1Q1_fos_565]